MVTDSGSEYWKMSIDPKLQYCSCGCSWRPGTYHKLLMLLFGSYTYTCPHCQSRLKFRLIGHVVKVKADNVDKKELWKNG